MDRNEYKIDKIFYDSDGTVYHIIYKSLDDPGNTLEFYPKGKRDDKEDDNRSVSPKQ